MPSADQSYITGAPLARERLVTALNGIIQSTPSSREEDLIFEGYQPLAAQQDSVRRFRRKDRLHHSHFDEIVGITVADGRFNALARTLFNTESCSWQSHLRLVLGARYIDGSIVTALASRTDPNDDFQWLGVKRMKFKLSNDVSRAREAIFYEFCGTTKDREGQRVFFIVRESVDPTLGETTGVRLQLQEQCVFTECFDGRIEIAHFYHADPGGHTPAFLFKKHALRHLAFAPRVLHIAAKLEAPLDQATSAAVPVEGIKLLDEKDEIAMKHLRPSVRDSAATDVSTLRDSGESEADRASATLADDMRRMQQSIREQRNLVQMMQMRLTIQSMANAMKGDKEILDYGPSE
ncbi:hypothetical protein ACHHYP_04709 [Achlya hypogyna]|uniref:START domain-containing protein n=1 Tax=Achlya hypogyna TaxID=1202772 RepID=A0A1V9Z0E8_ACHHY|nr:hypothetical protein ACHHYP_04709 [Achlya hypogyna]